tara:strand:- start:401 stop:721 length:321 start_codon:yes stop_codon:yes gene_type:complete
MLMIRFRPYLLNNIYFTLSVSVISGISNTSASYWPKGLGAQENAIDLIHAFIRNSAFGLVANFIPATFNVKYAHTSFFLVNWKLDDVRYERSDAWGALCNPDGKSH